ncbi:MAG: SpoIIIAH-like family protein [Clostridiales bacterium]|nr:SpoIIIAH-like family protein [Clostridiales bacterium]
MKLWKRNVVVAAIVLFVCVAVYLNWTYDQEAAAVSTSGDTSASALASEDGDTETKTLGEAALVSSDDAETAEETSGDTEEIVIDSWDSAEVTEDVTAETVSETGESSGYFAEARLSREEARASALSILQETVDDPEASEAAVSAAADSITAMASATLAESQIESLVTAKGYPECELSGADVAKITDIVLGETDFPASAVKVVLAEN